MKRVLSRNEMKRCMLFGYRIEAMRIAVGSLGRVQCILRPCAEDPVRSILAVSELEEAQVPSASTPPLS